MSRIGTRQARLRDLVSNDQDHLCSLMHLLDNMESHDRLLATTHRLTHTAELQSQCAGDRASKLKAYFRLLHLEQLLALCPHVCPHVRLPPTIILAYSTLTGVCTPSSSTRHYSSSPGSGAPRFFSCMA